MGAIVETVNLNTAEELLSELSPATGKQLFRRHRDFLSSVDTGWLFRGQANGADGTAWHLEPKAFRPSDFLPFTNGATVGYAESSPTAQRAKELELVMQFASRVDIRGFVVPGDSHEYRDRRTMPKSRDLGAAGEAAPFFPPPQLTAMFALGQHYGIPTRMLDWTWKPMVAAYFACVAVARRREPGKPPPAAEVEYFSVYALNEAVVHGTEGTDPEVHIMSVPTATNPNLHAQGGVFSLVQPVASDPHPLPRLDDALRANQEAIGKKPWAIGGTFQQYFPLLVEFRVPTAQACTALMLLDRLGVTAATVFPGLAGVVSEMVERRYYQWASNDARR